MSWSEVFAPYIAKRFGDGAQQKAAFALKVAPSLVSYWCRGATPREKMRRRIERWSKGEVPAAAAAESATALNDHELDDSAIHARGA